MGRKTSKAGAQMGGLLASGPGRGRPGAPARSVRIVAGCWRGRRVPFIPMPGLRPTPDRVRETLFNWLNRSVAAARCLDLCAGTGALAFEALSRGAASAVLVEQDPRVVRQLQEVARTLGADRARVVQGDARAFLKGPTEPFDLVFLDPPFALGVLTELCTLLADGGWLAPAAFVYLEQSARDAPIGLPQGWRVVREMRAGEVRAQLVQRDGG